MNPTKKYDQHACIQGKTYNTEITQVIDSVTVT
jgi:hypothetical protein